MQRHCQGFIEIGTGLFSFRFFVVFVAKVAIWRVLLQVGRDSERTSTASSFVGIAACSDLFGVVVCETF